MVDFASIRSAGVRSSLFSKPGAQRFVGAESPVWIPLFRRDRVAPAQAPGIKAPCASAEGSDVKETAG